MQGKQIILGALGAITIGAALWLSKEKPSKQQPIPNDILIKFLKDLRAQSYPHFFLVSSIIQRIKSEGNSQAIYEQILAKVKPEVETLFEKKQIMILCKYELTKEDVELSLELSKDETVKQLHQEFIQLYEGALDGQDPQIDLDNRTLSKYSAQQILQIMAKILITSVEVICLAAEELQLSGYQQILKLDQPIFMKALNNNGLSEKKIAILNNEGVIEFENEDSCALEVFSKLTQYNKLQNPKFKQCVDDLETAYESIITRLLARELQTEDARTAAVKIDVDEITKKLK